MLTLVIVTFPSAECSRLYSSNSKVRGGALFETLRKGDVMPKNAVWRAGAHGGHDLLPADTDAHRAGVGLRHGPG